MTAELDGLKLQPQSSLAEQVLATLCSSLTA